MPKASRGGARRVRGASCPCPDSAPYRRFPVCLHMTQFCATGNCSGCFRGPQQGSPGVAHREGEAEGQAQAPSCRRGVAAETLSAVSSSPPPCALSPTHLSCRVPLPSSPPPADPSPCTSPAPSSSGPLPRPSFSPRRPDPGPPVGPAAPIPAAARPLTPSWARRGPAR